MEPRRRRPELGGVTVLVLVTALVWLAAPHARSVRGMVAGGLPQLPQPPVKIVRPLITPIDLRRPLRNLLLRKHAHHLHHPPLQIRQLKIHVSGTIDA